MTRTIRRNRLQHYRQNQAFGRPFRLNKHSPQARGLVGWWPTVGLSSNSKLLDYSGYGKHSTSSTGTLTLSRAAEMGKYIDYDGDGNVYTMPNRSNDEPAAVDRITITAWVLPAMGQSRGIMRIAGGAGTTTIFNLHGDANLGSYTEIAGTTQNDYNQDHWGVGIWQLAALSCDNVEFRLTKNGVLVRAPVAATGGIGLGGGGGVTIGQEGSATTRSFADGIADVRLYACAKTDAEVSQISAPQTRWDLYEPIPRIFPVLAPAVAGDPEGSLVGGKLTGGGILVKGRLVG